MESECLDLDWLFDGDSLSSMRVNQLTYTEPEVVRRVYLLAEAVARLLEAAGIFYWTSGGTTLGIVRLVIGTPKWIQEFVENNFYFLDRSVK
jgi:hypothetical protein